MFPWASDICCLSCSTQQELKPLHYLSFCLYRDRQCKNSALTKSKILLSSALQSGSPFLKWRKGVCRKERWKSVASSKHSSVRSHCSAQRHPVLFQISAEMKNPLPLWATCDWVCPISQWKKLFLLQSKLFLLPLPITMQHCKESVFTTSLLTLGNSRQYSKIFFPQTEWAQISEPLLYTPDGLVLDVCNKPTWESCLCPHHWYGSYSGTAKDSEVKFLSLTVYLRRKNKIQRLRNLLFSRFYAINHVAIAVQNFFLVHVKVSSLCIESFVMLLAITIFFHIFKLINYKENK